MLVRPALPSDAAALAALLNEIVVAGGTTAIEDTLSPKEFDHWFIGGPDVLCCTLAEDTGGAVLGVQSLARNAALPAGWGDIATFARRGGTRRGIGRALFTETRARAAALGLAALNATIRADNAGGLAYYEKMGFCTYRTTPGVPLRDGTPVDRIAKRLRLSGQAAAG